MSRVSWLVVPHSPPRLKKLSPRNLDLSRGPTPPPRLDQEEVGTASLHRQAGAVAVGGWVGVVQSSSSLVVVVVVCAHRGGCLSTPGQSVRLLPTIDWRASQHRQPASVGCELLLPRSDGEGGGQGANYWSEGGR